MATYVAFLRSINVGTHGRIKMDELVKVFAGVDAKNVRTYIQSGNVIFESAEKDLEKLAVSIEAALQRKMKIEVACCLRTGAEVRAIANADPFKGNRLRKTGKYYVTFLREAPEPARAQALEGFSSEIELFKVKGCEVYVVFTAEKSAKVKFSGNAVEKTLGVRATGRNHNVVCEIAELLDAEQPGRLQKSHSSF